MKIVAFAGDLMDRSRITAAFEHAAFTLDPAAAAGADVVFVDLARHGALLGRIRDAAPDARVVGFGPHVDDDALRAARAAGASAAMPRSRFFHDVRAAAFGTATDR